MATRVIPRNFDRKVSRKKNGIVFRIGRLSKPGESISRDDVAMIHRGDEKWVERFRQDSLELFLFLCFARVNHL